jgi:hypothetical protein
MKKTELSIKSWSIYLFVLGLSMVILPAVTVSWFGYSAEGELWIRVVGILSVVLAMYYMLMVRYHVFEMYKWKIAGHLFGITCMTAFLVLGAADNRIVGTITMEVLAGAWTAIALKADNKVKVAKPEASRKDFVKQAS